MMYPLIAARAFAALLMLINYRCECLILDVRSKRLLGFCCLLGLAIDELSRISPVPILLIQIFVNPLITFVAPIVLSQGPLYRRITRVAILCVASLLSEVVCTICYLILEHEAIYTTVDASNFPSVIATYMTGTTIHVLITEFIISRLAHDEQDWVPQLEFPILAFSVGSYLFLTLSVGRFGRSGSQEMILPLLMFVVGILSIGLAFVLHYLVHTDTRIAREAAERTATLRQTRHVRHQIEKSASRLQNMSILRHDLANQMGVVVELARTEREGEADRYLAKLLERTKEFLDESHE